jgi:hypothetical protein
MPLSTSPTNLLYLHYITLIPFCKVLYASAHIAVAAALLYPKALVSSFYARFDPYKAAEQPQQTRHSA